MRIIKTSEQEPEFSTPEACVHFFESELFGRNRGYFSIPPGHIAAESLKEGEPLVFSHQKMVKYVAIAASGLTKSNGADRDEYPFGFFVREATLEAIRDTSIKDFERELRKVVPDIKTIAGSQGWNIIPNNDKTAAILAALPRQFTVAQRKFGTGGEGPEHLRLKEWVHDHPEAIQLQNVKDRKMEHTFLSGDAVDVLFITDNESDVVVEIETDNPLPGAHQLLKYRALRCGQRRIPLDSNKVRAVLVAWSVDEFTAQFCTQYEITWFEMKL